MQQPGSTRRPPASERTPALVRLHVRRVAWLTPHMIRITAGGAGIEAYRPNGCTDQYVRLLFRQPGVRYPDPFDISAIREALPRYQWPATRTYTVRRIDRELGELDIDIVYHGEVGVAGRWAASAKPGDELLLLGPGGTYAPRPEADWHLFVGDAAALPAIGAALERIRPGVPAVAVIEVAELAERHQLSCPGELTAHWIYPSGAAGGGAALLATVRALEFPAGQVHAFVHGEAQWVRTLRRHLRAERGVAREWLSISGYWRQGFDEEGFREAKARERLADTIGR